MANRPTRLSADTLDLFQRVLNIKLPKPYRDFLQETNGIYPGGATFSFEGRSGELHRSVLHHVCGINSPNTHDDLWESNAMLKEQLGSDYLKIADDAGGNLILIAVRGRTYGKVFFMDHEVEYHPTREGLEGLGLIADSFQEFLNGLSDQ